MTDRVSFFEHETWTAGVIGLGYVGLPLAVNAVRRGLPTVGFDVDPARNRSTGGSGLGLSIARSVMRSHGGDILLANREQGGLAVRLQLVDMATP